MRVGFACQRDRVLVDLGGRRRDLMLEPWDAARFAEELERQAAHCERWLAAGGRGELVKGSSWTALVRSWDGLVNIRFNCDGAAGLHARLSIPAAAARQLANETRLKVTEARFRVSILSQLRATVGPLP